MSRVKWAFVPGAVIALWIIPAAGQEHPDFSGRWVLVSPSAPAASDVPRALSVQQTLVKTNVRGEPMAPFLKDITVQKVSDAGTHTETHRIGVVGGVVGGFAEDGSRAGPSRHFAVTWDGDALVFESGSDTDPDNVRTPQIGWTERREVWSLDTAGRLHVVIVTRDATSGDRTVALVYRRQ